jgi:hypothetical protein
MYRARARQTVLVSPPERVFRFIIQLIDVNAAHKLASATVCLAAAAHTVMPLFTHMVVDMAASRTAGRGSSFLT